MEAETAAELPRGAEWQYEPKWDGFRCIAFRDGDSIRLQSKAGKPLERYFPELVDELRALGARKFVLDGEIVVEREGRLAFDHLLMRIHPAASRIARLAREEPPALKVFDLLVDERGMRRTGEAAGRTASTARTVRRDGSSSGPLRSRFPASRAAGSRPSRWLAGSGIDTDGVVAKRLDLPYQSGNRHGMVKVKRIRSADCVVGGFRYASKGQEHRLAPAWPVR